MRIALALFVWASALLPATAGPQGCRDHDETAQISCAAGSIWDAEAARCVTLES